MPPLLDLTLNFAHLESRSPSKVLDFALQPLRLCNFAKSLLPKCPLLQARAVLAVHVARTKLVNPLAGKEDPSNRGWYIHCRVPVLIRRLVGFLDTCREAMYCVIKRAYRVLTPIEVDGGEGSSVEQRYGLTIPVVFHLLFVVDVCS